MELDTHIATKVEGDYTLDNWQVLLSHLTSGKVAIDDAANKNAVDMAKTVAIQAINEVKKMLKAGFSGGDPAAPYRCAYVSENTEFEIDSVTLRFSFAINGQLPHLEDIEGSLYFKLFFFETSLNADEAINWHLITEILVNEFNKDKYETLTDNSEEYTIPRELFVNQQGCIEFTVQEYWIWNDGREPQHGSLGFIRVYYKLIDEKVVLSPTEFQ